MFTIAYRITGGRSCLKSVLISYPPVFINIATDAVAIGVKMQQLHAIVTRITGPIGLHSSALLAIIAIGIKV